MTNERMPSYGGQALIEGVLMRGQKYLAAAFRLPNQEIVVKTEKLPTLYQSRWLKVPFLRGMITLWDSLGLGTKYLFLSANLQGEGDVQIEGKTATLTMLTSLSLSVGLFFLLPAFLGKIGEHFLTLTAFGGSLLESGFRFLILLGYLGLVRLSPEVKRVFAYHGAEHKTINAYEAQAEMIPSVIARYSLEHPRCGTAFLLTLILVAMIVFAFINPVNLFLRLLSRLLLLPFLAGIAYEIIRFTTNYQNHWLMRRLLRPNLWLQQLTTAEPTSAMLEVAWRALETVQQLEKDNLSETTSEKAI